MLTDTNPAVVVGQSTRTLGIHLGHRQTTRFPCARRVGSGNTGNSHQRLLPHTDRHPGPILWVQLARARNVFVDHAARARRFCDYTASLFFLKVHSECGWCIRRPMRQPLGRRLSYLTATITLQGNSPAFADFAQRPEVLLSSRGKVRMSPLVEEGDSLLDSIQPKTQSTTNTGSEFVGKGDWMPGTELAVDQSG